MRSRGVVVLARDDDEVVVRLDDEDLRSGLVDLRWHLTDHVLCGARSLVVDVSDVEGLPSAVIAVLLRAKRCCRARGGRVTLRHPSPAVVRVLRTTGLAGVFELDRARRSRVAARVPA